MDNERKKKLQETLKKFNKDHKAEIFTMGSEIVDTQVIPSGVSQFDEFIGGGFKQGAHTIIWGQYSVGKTALILSTIANAQKQGKFVCFVNTEKPINIERFKFFNINLSEMVYIEAPSCAEDALEAMRTLCKDNVTDLFIIDSVNGLSPKSSQEGKEGAERSLEKKDVAALALTLSNFYNKVNAHVFRAKSAVIWIGQARTQGIGGYFVRQGLSGGKAQEFYAYQIIQMRKDEKSNNPVRDIRVYTLNEAGKLTYKTVEEEIGFSAVLKLEKTNSSKSLRQNSEIRIPYYFETGFNIPAEKELEIRIEGTDKEKEVINEMLIAKGVLKTKTENEQIIKTRPFTKEETEALDNGGLSKEEFNKICEENSKKSEVKSSKQRGRPKKDK